MQEMNNCPYCGEHDLEVNRYNNDCAVHCKHCGAIGPTRETPELAIIAWNTRVQEEPELIADKVSICESSVAHDYKCPFYPTHECQGGKCMMWVWADDEYGRCGLVPNFANLSYDGVDK